MGGYRYQLPADPLADPVCLLKNRFPAPAFQKGNRTEGGNACPPDNLPLIIHKLVVENPAGNRQLAITAYLRRHQGMVDAAEVIAADQDQLCVQFFYQVYHHFGIIQGHQ